MEGFIAAFTFSGTVLGGVMIWCAFSFAKVFDKNSPSDRRELAATIGLWLAWLFFFGPFVLPVWYRALP